MIFLSKYSWDDHLRHIRQVLARLRAHGLTAKPQKCEWEIRQTGLFRHASWGRTIEVPESRVRAIREYKSPTTKNDIQSFVGK